MKILGIETSTAVCGVALVDDEHLVADYRLNIKHFHAEKLVRLVDHLLSDTNTTLAQVDGIAVSIGPGSFTGLRIGMSVAKGLAVSQEKPLLAIPTLDALAQNGKDFFPHEQSVVICPVVDAKADEVYYALYRLNGQGLKRVGEYQITSFDRLLTMIFREEKIVFVGDAVYKLLNFLKERKILRSKQYLVPPEEVRICSAVSVAKLGREKLIKAELADVESLEPFYLKDFVIKEKHSA